MATSPYGFWKSPITSDLVVADSIRLEQVALDGDAIYWSETQPQKQGRTFVYRVGADGEPECVTPDDANAFSVRARAHEYGGGSFAVSDGVIYFSNNSDQRLYRQDASRPPSPITPASAAAADALRYADGVIDRRRERMVCVWEDHTGAGEARAGSRAGQTSRCFSRNGLLTELHISYRTDVRAGGISIASTTARSSLWRRRTPNSGDRKGSSACQPTESSRDRTTRTEAPRSPRCENSSQRGASGRSRFCASSPNRRGRRSASGFHFIWRPSGTWTSSRSLPSPGCRSSRRISAACLAAFSRRGVVLGALMMIGPASTGLVSSPITTIALFCVGGFAHQTISVLVNTLSADLFDSREVGAVSSFAGMAAWTGGLGFSLLVGALADTLGYGPLFGLLGVFDLVGAAAPIVLIGGERHAERFAAA